MKPDDPIIIFDTDCVLCSGTFVLAHESAPVLRFAGAWSQEGLALAARYGFSRSDLNDTFLVIAKGTALARSDAGIAVLALLRAPWRWLVALRFVLKPLRDFAYLFIARRRYRLFGRRENCTVAPPEQPRSVSWGCGQGVIPALSEASRNPPRPVSLASGHLARQA